MLHLILVLILIGVLLWLVNAYVPMAQPIKTLVNIVVVVVAVIYVLQAFGLVAYIDRPVPRLR